MKPEKTYQRIKGLIQQPAKEWEVIQKESYSAGQLFVKHLLPVLILYFICSLLGNILFTNDIVHSTTYRLAYVITKCCLVFCGFFLSFLWLSIVYKKAGLNVPSDTIFVLLFYAYLAVWLVASLTALLANYKMLCRALHLLALDGLVIYWTGAEKLIMTSEEKKKILYPVIFIMLIFIYLFIYLLLKHFMSFISFLQALIQLFAKP